MTDTAKREAAFKMKKAADDLNAAIRAAAKLNLHVEIDVLSKNSVLSSFPHVNICVYDRL